jgi:hypothetical protein
MFQVTIETALAIMIPFMGAMLFSDFTQIVKDIYNNIHTKWFEWKTTRDTVRLNALSSSNNVVVLEKVKETIATQGPLSPIQINLNNPNWIYGDLDELIKNKKFRNNNIIYFTKPRKEHDHTCN